MEETKTCKVCGEIKPHNSFPERGKLCKVCCNVRNREAYQEVAPSGEKPCQDCGIAKSTDQFEKRGKSSRCKDCGAKYAQERRVAAGGRTRAEIDATPKPTRKLCKVCGIEKPMVDFPGKQGIGLRCKDCKNEAAREGTKMGKKAVGLKECKSCNIEKPLNEFRHQNARCNECQKERARELAPRRRPGKKARHDELMATDPVYRVRHNVSRSIRGALKTQGGTKCMRSIMGFVPWTLDTLRDHLEKLFSHPDNLTANGEAWMTWENQGIYRVKDWDDNDPGTWVWQLDHIIPHSTFYYASMDCQEFRDCWALPNLRPLSAKTNQLDGATKVRHKKVS